MPKGAFVGGWWYPLSRLRKNARGEWELKPDRAVVVVKDVHVEPEPEPPADEPATAEPITTARSVTTSYDTKVVRSRRGGDADGDKAAGDGDR
jgi:hypothetical protein